MDTNQTADFSLTNLNSMCLRNDSIEKQPGGESNKQPKAALKSNANSTANNNRNQRNENFDINNNNLTNVTKDLNFIVDHHHQSNSTDNDNEKQTAPSSSSSSSSYSTHKSNLLLNNLLTESAEKENFLKSMIQMRCTLNEFIQSNKMTSISVNMDLIYKELKSQVLNEFENFKIELYQQYINDTEK